MKVKLTEQQLRRVILKEQQEGPSVLLMTGLRSGVGHEEQEKNFRKGLPDGNIQSFMHENINGLLEAIEENPDAIVVLYSAAGRHVAIVAAVMNNINNLYVVEPWWNGNKESSRYLDMQASGIPPQNVQVGPSSGRGKGIIDDPTPTPENMGHYKALTYAGEQL